MIKCHHEILHILFEILLVCEVPRSDSLISYIASSAFRWVGYMSREMLAQGWVWGVALG